MAGSDCSDAYALLGLPRTLVGDEESVRAAHRAAVLACSQGAMPGSAASLNEARDVLLDPARRVKHWLGLCGWNRWQAVPLSEEFMEFFSRLGPIIHQAQDLSRQLSRQSTALGRASLAPRVLALRRQLEFCSEQLRGLQDPILASLRLLDDHGQPLAEEQLASVAMDQARLAYLVKWRHQISQALGALFF